MSVARLPHLSVTNELQHRRRYNDLATAVGTGFFTSGATFSGTSAAANVEFSIVHNLGHIPTGFVLLANSPAGTLYGTPTSGTHWTTTTIYLKSTTSSMAYTVYVN